MNSSPRSSAADLTLASPTTPTTPTTPVSMRKFPKSADAGAERKELSKSTANLMEFLQAGPSEEMDFLEFLTASAPTTEVYVSNRLDQPRASISSRSSDVEGLPFVFEGEQATTEQLASLSSFLRSLSELNGKSHTHALKRYQNSFRGDDLVSILLRKKIVTSRDDGVRLGQQLIDGHFIWHAEVDQQFKDSSTPYRFITPDLYLLCQAITDPYTGIANSKSLPSMSGSTKKDRDSFKSKSVLSLTIAKFVFTGLELLDWIFKFAPIRPSTKDAAARQAQSLLDSYIIHQTGGNFDDQVFNEAASYAITRENVSVQSLQSPTRKEWLPCQLGSQVGKGKWKERFVVFMGEQQRLYLFNSEDSITPSSVINLKSAIIRNGDESLVGKTNCIQITMDAGSLMIEVPSQESRTMWLADLKNYAANKKETSSQTGRQSRSFRVRIVEGKNFPGGNYYCVVYLGDASVARTSVQWKIKSGSPVWGDEFVFLELPSSLEGVRVIAYSKGQLQDQEIGSANIKLGDLSSHSEMDEWINLKPPGKATNDKQKTPPMLHLRFTLEYELILPLKSYESLLSLVVDEFKLLSSLLSLTTTEREQVTQTILRVLMTQGKAHAFVMELVRREISATTEKNTLFRVNTVGTKAVVEYLKLAGVSYVRETLKPFILGLDKYNVDPEKSETYLNVIRDLWDVIYKSVVRIPPDLFLFFYELSNAALERFANKSTDQDVVNNVGYMVVNGFFFLRLICPAVIAPKVYGIIENHPDDKTAHILKNVARVLQYLANFKSEVDADAYDAEGAVLLNGFLKDNIPSMKSFIQQIASRDNGTSQKFNMQPVDLNIDLEREMANLYAVIIRYNQELLDLCREQTRNALSTTMESISLSYKERWPGRSTMYQYKISLADAMLFLK